MIVCKESSEVQNKKVKKTQGEKEKKLPLLVYSFEKDVKQSKNVFQISILKATAIIHWVGFYIHHLIQSSL